MNTLPPLLAEAAILEEQPPNTRTGWELLKTTF
jgi:hypothetical protein